MPPLVSGHLRLTCAANAARPIAAAITTLLLVMALCALGTTSAAGATAPEPEGATANPFAEPVGGEALTRGGVLSPEGVDDSAPDVPAAAYVVADLDTGEVLAAKNAKDQLQPAASLQLLTALTLTPRLDPEARYTLTANDAEAAGRTAGLRAGVTYSMDDLFHGLLLRAGTDATSALVNAAGGTDAVTSAMTAEATRIGAFDTSIIGPTVSSHAEHYTTAYDLSLIAQAGLENETLADYAGTLAHELPNGGGPEQDDPVADGPRGDDAEADPDLNAAAAPLDMVRIENRNLLLTRYPNSFGVFASEGPAGENTVIGAAERDDRRLLVTVMDGEAPSWRHAATLLDWGFDTPADVAPVGDLVTADDVAEAVADAESGTQDTPSGDPGADDSATETSPTTGDDKGSATAESSSSAPVAWLEGLDYTLLMLLGLAAMFVVMAGARVRSVLIARRGSGAGDDADRESSAG